MDEEQYRRAYSQLNPIRCVYEKSINSRRTRCSLSHRFCLADREGVSCLDADKQARCTAFLRCLRPKAMFALQLTKLPGPLPHAKEIKIQTGGILGIKELLQNNTEVMDINALLDQLQSQYGDFDHIPLDPVIRTLAHYKDRQKKIRR